MNLYYALVATKDDEKTLCGAFKDANDAKVRWYDVVYILGYESTKIVKLDENELSEFSNFELRFPEVIYPSED